MCINEDIVLINEQDVLFVVDVGSELLFQKSKQKGTKEYTEKMLAELQKGSRKMKNNHHFLDMLEHNSLLLLLLLQALTHLIGTQTTRTKTNFTI